MIDTAAGETELSKDEIIEWCRDWARNRVYAIVGQNCWSMVHTFLTDHEGCEVPESIRYAFLFLSILKAKHVWECLWEWLRGCCHAGRGVELLQQSWATPVRLRPLSRQRDEYTGG